MGWIKNTNKEKPEVDTRYKKHKYSVNVLIHIRGGLTFIGYWDYDEGCWYADTISIDDEKVVFWCNIPKLPKLA